MRMGEIHALRVPFLQPSEILILAEPTASPQDFVRLVPFLDFEFYHGTLRSRVLERINSRASKPSAASSGH